MADRYDPKLSLRPVGDRRAGDARRVQSLNDDPLAELAKIVSGRTTGPTPRGRTAPANDVPATPGGDALGDLETELLNDLQASFAAVRDTLSEAVAVPKPAPPPTPLPVRSDPIPPPPSRGPEPAHEADPFEDLLPAHLAERLAPAPAAAAPPQPVPRLADQLRPEVRRPLPANAETPSRPDSARRPDSLPARSTAEAPDFSAFRTRADEAPPVENAPPSASGSRARSRWEKPEPAKPSSAVSRFAPPPRAVAPPPRHPPPRDEDDDFDALAEIAGTTEDEEAEDFPLDGFGELQSDDDEGEPPPFPEGDLASMMEPRRSRTPVLIAGVIGLVLVGGIAVAMFRPTTTDTSAPPVIVADGEPTRITPAETAATDAEQNKLIYDRVNSGEQNADTTLLTPNEEPIAAVPADDAAADNAISRVIIPAGPGFDDPSAEEEGLSLDGQPSTMPPDDQTQLAAGGTGDPIEAIGPRRVRTVVVKPDGTIVESGASEAGQSEPVLAAPAPPVLSAPAGTPAAEAALPPVIEPPAPAPVTDDTAAIAGTGSNGELAITPVPEIGGGEVSPEPTPLPTPTPEPQPQAQPAPAPAVTAAVEPAAPIDLSQNPAPPSGGMLVQVSSQRSEDAARATFRDLQARYPNILGPYDVNIQRADIPDRGTFFRVRVGPFSASDAQRLCNDLKSAGGDCILAQR